MAPSKQQDFYAVLEVERDATADQIKSAYRKAAMKWNPDRNPNTKHEADLNFRAAAEAYSVLSDPQKRSIYDRFGHAGLGSRGFESGGFNASIFEDFQDILGDLFGFEGILGAAAGGGAARAGNGDSVARICATT